jgi:hypothetical protein
VPSGQEGDCSVMRTKDHVEQVGDRKAKGPR